MINLSPLIAGRGVAAMATRSLIKATMRISWVWGVSTARKICLLRLDAKEGFSFDRLDLPRDSIANVEPSSFGEIGALR